VHSKFSKICEAKFMSFPSFHANPPTAPIPLQTPPVSVVPPAPVAVPPTLADMHLTGACDWFKLSKLVHAENRLIDMLKQEGLTENAWKLEQLRDDVLGHRMANSPYDNMYSFLQNNCGNDTLIHKWRSDIDSFERSLAATLAKARIPNPHHYIELKYQASLLKHQARASLPYTGYSNPGPRIPKIPRIYKEHKYEPRFIFHPFSIPERAVLSGFL
jgi:hypothetical protein